MSWDILCVCYLETSHLFPDRSLGVLILSWACMAMKPLAVHRGYFKESILWTHNTKPALGANGLG